MICLEWPLALTSTESIMSPGSTRGSLQTSALSPRIPWTKGSSNSELLTPSHAIHCCFLIILASKDFPYFPAMSACYCSLKKLIKKPKYIKKETMTVYKFRSASVSTTLSAHLLNEIRLFKGLLD